MHSPRLYFTEASSTIETHTYLRDLQRQTLKLPFALATYNHNPPHSMLFLKGIQHNQPKNSNSSTT